MRAVPRRLLLHAVSAGVGRYLARVLTCKRIGCAVSDQMRLTCQILQDGLHHPYSGYSSQTESSAAEKRALVMFCNVIYVGVGDCDIWESDALADIGWLLIKLWAGGVIARNGVVGQPRWFSKRWLFGYSGERSRHQQRERKSHCSYACAKSECISPVCLLRL